MKRFVISLFSLTGLLLSACTEISAQEWESFFETETITIDPNQHLVPSGLISLPDSKKFALSTTRGEVWVVDYRQGFSKLQWQPFATGLRKPSQLLTLKQQPGLAVLQNGKSWTHLTDSDADGKADNYFEIFDTDSLAKPPAVASPFKGVTWLPEPKQSHPFKGQYFGHSKSDHHISRLASVTNATGNHFTMFVLEAGFRYPIDTLIELPDQSWLISQSNRNDPSRTRMRAILQRLVWKPELKSFELESIIADKNQMTLTFTHDLNPETAEAAWAYKIENLKEQKPLRLSKIKMDATNNKQVTLHFSDPITPKTIYHLTCDAVWSADRNPVRNANALFTWLDE